MKLERPKQIASAFQVQEIKTQISFEKKPTPSLVESKSEKKEKTKKEEQKITAVVPIDV